MINDVITAWLDGVQTDLVANYDRMGLRASGNWANSLEQFQQGSGTRIRFGIFGNDYTNHLQLGRRPNKKQDKESIRKWVGWAGSTIIADWVKQKGIIASPYAIAHKIATEGWKVPNKHNVGGLVTDVVTDQRILELNKQLSAFIIVDYKKLFQ